MCQRDIQFEVKTIKEKLNEMIVAVECRLLFVCVCVSFGNAFQKNYLDRSNGISYKQDQQMTMAQEIVIFGQRFIVNSTSSLFIFRDATWQNSINSFHFVASLSTTTRVSKMILKRKKNHNTT